MRDPLGILPAGIRERYAREEAVEREVRGAREMTRLLREHFGPDVEAVRVGPRADPGQFSGKVMPGYWHVRVHRPLPGIPHYIPVTTPEGGYREPSARVVGELFEMDLRRPEVMRRFLERARTDSPNKEAERELRSEQRRDILKSDFRAAKRVRGEGGLKKSFEGKRSKAQKRYEEGQKAA